MHVALSKAVHYVFRKPFACVKLSEVGGKKMARKWKMGDVVVRLVVGGEHHYQPPSFQQD